MTGTVRSAARVAARARVGSWPVAAAAAAVLLLLSGCVAVAWPDASPLVPRNGGHPGGDEGWAVAFLGLLAAAYAAYAGALWLAWRGRVPRGAALAVAVAVQLLPLAAPLLLSTDAWSYWDYGRLAAEHGANPYDVVPSAFPGDPAFAFMGTRWHDTTSVYGPLFTLVSEPAGLAAGGSADAAAWLWKAVAAAAMVAAALAAGRLSRRPAVALVAVGWSPLLAVHAAGAGHNDALVAAALLGGLVAAGSGRPLVAGAGWAVAAAVKWVPLLLLPLRVVAAVRDGSWRAPGARRAVLGFAGVAVAVAAAASARYGWHWLGAFGPLARNADDATSYSATGRLEQLGLAHGAAVALPLAALGGAALLLLRGAWRSRRARVGLAAVLVVALSPLLAPWYLLWAVPLAAADDDAPALLAALALGAYVLAQTVPL